MADLSLNSFQKYLLLGFSFCLVAFGQPAWIWWFGLLASFFGYACFWRVLLTISSRLERFITAMGWFAGVQIVQLSWALSHPYLYMYPLLVLIAWFLGAQWGVLALWITPSSLKKTSTLFALSGGWVLLEWSRLFVLSGFPFDPIGLALTGSIYSLQFVAIGGVYLLSYWVALTNLFVLRTWFQNAGNIRSLSWITCLLIALTPYGFGWLHIHQHAARQAQSTRQIETLLVQTAFPVEQKISFASFEQARHFVLNQWKQIFALIADQHSTSPELIVLPENLVPYGTYSLVFSFPSALEAWTGAFGLDAVKSLPALEGPFADFVEIDKKLNWYVNNAYFCQALANLFQAHLIIGLEDQLYLQDLKEESYSAALHFYPRDHKLETYEISRYKKRILVPMGEYIPFEFCRKLASKYGVQGSFTPGKTAKLFNGPVPLGPSICYEEAFGHLMRDNRLKGAELFVNITNDGWYPHSKLPQQHFDHSRLRAIENGVPLVRACNTGVTGAIDSLGRIVGTWGKDSTEAQEKAGAFKVSVPTYHFSTLYTFWGDYFVLILSITSLLFGIVLRKKS